MSKFIKLNRFTGYRIAWDKVEPGARAIEETRLSVTGKDGKRLAFGCPMLTSEVEVFTDMQNRKVNRTLDVANEYTIE